MYIRRGKEAQIIKSLFLILHKKKSFDNKITTLKARLTTLEPTTAQAHPASSTRLPVRDMLFTNPATIDHTRAAATAPREEGQRTFSHSNHHLRVCRHFLLLPFPYYLGLSMSPSADDLYLNLWVWSTCGVVTWIQMGLGAGSSGPRMITYRLPVCICACTNLHDGPTLLPGRTPHQQSLQMHCPHLQ